MQTNKLDSTNNITPIDRQNSVNVLFSLKNNTLHKFFNLSSLLQRIKPLYTSNANALEKNKKNRCDFKKQIQSIFEKYNLPLSEIQNQVKILKILNITNIKLQADQSPEEEVVELQEIARNLNITNENLHESLKFIGTIGSMYDDLKNVLENIITQTITTASKDEINAFIQQARNAITLTNEKNIDANDEIPLNLLLDIYLSKPKKITNDAKQNLKEELLDLRHDKPILDKIFNISHPESLNIDLVKHTYDLTVYLAYTSCYLLPIQENKEKYPVQENEIFDEGRITDLEKVHANIINN